MSRLLLALLMLAFPDTSLKLSRYERSFERSDCPREVCLRVSLTPLSFHNGRLQICNIYH